MMTKWGQWGAAEDVGVFKEGMYYAIVQSRHPLSHNQGKVQEW